MKKVPIIQHPQKMFGKDYELPEIKKDLILESDEDDYIEGDDEDMDVDVDSDGGREGDGRTISEMNNQNQGSRLKNAKKNALVVFCALVISYISFHQL